LTQELLYSLLVTQKVVDKFSLNFEEGRPWDKKQLIRFLGNLDMGPNPGVFVYFIRFKIN